ncbi:hypothetical protein M441DRAFT_407723 [Trichoderma asperellum CBS 433.97]|uniref:Uncharacterized protein n=1 Tax=Trichoderma asperellum (strain ATCC 204424 / CBS 433.97 / NBRC 101777) TaxID=1042311 RepID=A0A2T3Z6T7_TRIA4|nr:hypothetical protein M441DRAFT_407723 [Trichoderma asperellum CBS 433.97]PTB40537.1 hypothetical protein M441DRAFT_407723 [Trichoderma asperellum CBS 433.97]
MKNLCVWIGGEGSGRTNNIKILWAVALTSAAANRRLGARIGPPSSKPRAGASGASARGSSFEAALAKQQYDVYALYKAGHRRSAAASAVPMMLYCTYCTIWQHALSSATSAPVKAAGAKGSRIFCCCAVLSCLFAMGQYRRHSVCAGWSSRICPTSIANMLQPRSDVVYPHCM